MGSLQGHLLASADMEATRAIKWMVQLRTSGGSLVPEAWVLQPMTTDRLESTYVWCRTVQGRLVERGTRQIRVGRWVSNGDVQVRVALPLSSSSGEDGGEQATLLSSWRHKTESEDPSTSDQEGRSSCRMRISAPTPWSVRRWLLRSCPLYAVVLAPR